MSFSKKDKIGGTIKVKRPGPKQTKPGNWKESEIIDSKKGDSPSSNSVTSPGPIINQLDEKDVATFATGRPLEDQPDYLVCKHCKKPVIKTVAHTHIKSCLKQKQEKARKKKEAKEAAARDKDTKDKGKGKDKDGDTKMEETPNGKAGGEYGEGSAEKVKSAKKSAVKDANEDGPKKGKKRKADGEGEKAPKMKKKKEEPKPKVPKPKGPVDVEKQCGVPLANGAQCARSLTCKSHSMGAKRAVPGRSLPYDMLLAAYQKKNQAKQQSRHYLISAMLVNDRWLTRPIEAAIDANAPLQDDFDTNAGPVDSDEEKDAIMAAISRSRPQPLETRIFVPTRQKYHYIRMKEMLSSALGGSRGGGLFSTGDSGGPGGQGFFGGDNGVANAFASRLGSSASEQGGQYDGHARKPSLMQQALGQNRPMFASQVPPSRKASTSSTSAQQ
ncbi:MAG: hypothetical protein M1827_006860 [Pycnora praestabilis]|nr:MAG: hypothetical protein M1827_006860 [Pycnora praestabilis]